MDSYSVKVLNAHGALAELVSVIQGTLQHEIAGWHLAPVWKETRQKVQTDIVLPRYAPELFKRIIKALADEVADSKRPQLLRAHEEILFLLGEVRSNYLTRLTDGLQDAIQNEDLSRVDAITGALASELFTRRHPHSLYDLGFMLKENFEGKWDQFLDVVHSRPKSFTVFIPFIGDRDLVRTYSQDLDFTLIPREELVERGHDLSSLKTEQGVTVPADLAVLQIEAEDVRTAGVKAFNRIQSSANTFHFFYDETKAQLTQPWVLVEHDGSHGRVLKVVTVREDSTSSEREGQMRNVLWVVSQSDTSPETKQRLQTVVDYCAYAKKTRTISSRFLHNWVALETLFGYAQEGFILTRRYLPAILNLEYVFRLIRNFIDDCWRCGVRLDSVLGMRMARSQRAVEELLDVFRDDGRTARLLALTQGEDLLHFRAQQLQRRLATGPQVAKLLKSHHERLEWHLLRLYRIRNDLVHIGRTTSLTAPCLPHLEDYVTRALAHIAYLMKTHELHDIRRAVVLGYHSYFMSIEHMESNVAYDPDVVLR